VFRRCEAIGKSEMRNLIGWEWTNGFPQAQDNVAPLALFSSVTLSDAAVARLQIAFSSRLSIRRRS